MKRAVALMALSLSGSLAAPLSAAPGGQIGILPNGTYRCEMPGDALGPLAHRVEDSDFTIITASTYQVGDRLGSYLLTGDRVVMTSGPFKGRRYHRLSDNFLRQMRPDGSDGLLRCVRPRGIRR